MLAAGTLVTHADSRLLADGLVAALYQQDLARLGDAVVAGQSSPVLRAYQILGDPGLALGAANAPRGGPGAAPGRGSYAEWAQWAFAPSWSDLGLDRAAEADADQDGASNYAEYVAGTDPADGGSRLTLSINRVRVLGGGRVELTWPAVPGRSYRVERSVGVAGEYVPVATGLAATAPWNTWTDDPQAAGAMNCYRIVVE